MFEDSLMESTRHLSKRRGWITLLSSGLQMIVLAILVVLPLLHTEAISLQERKPVVTLAPYVPQPTSTGHRPLTGRADSGGVTPVVVRMTQPSSIPRIISTGPEPQANQIAMTQCLNKDCGMPSGDIPGGWGPDLPPVPPKHVEKPLQISHIDPGHIILRIEPVYPPLARATRTQGAVTLHATISRDGVIENLQLVGGHPLLVPAALDAVKQWRFRPYVLNGQPIEVETEITINFILGNS
jgi:protein TonB